MNSKYTRMRALLEPPGITFKEGGMTNAEIYAYAAGLDAVQRVLDAAQAAVFFPLSETADLSAYAEMLRLDSARYTEEELKDEIYNRLSHTYGDYTAADILNEFQKIGSGSYSVTDKIIFSELDAEGLAELGKFTDAFLPYGTGAEYSDEGLTFDEWDSWGLTFGKYDSLRLAFDILDRLTLTNRRNL